MTEQNMNEQNNESVAQPPRRNHRQPREHNRIDYIRQWLNIIFMLGAVVGVIFYFLSDRNTGVIILLTAIVFKFVECVLRVINR